LKTLLNWILQTSKGETPYAQGFRPQRKLH